MKTSRVAQVQEFALVNTIEENLELYEFWGKQESYYSKVALFKYKGICPILRKNCQLFRGVGTRGAKGQLPYQYF